MQLNTNGTLNSPQQLLQLRQDQKILITCFQETKLRSSSNTSSLEGYAVLRKDHPQGQCGGLITLLHHSVANQEVQEHTFLPRDTIDELQALTVELDGAQLLVCNVYIPPASSCPRGYAPDFKSLLTYHGDILIMGDFNAHDTLWYSFTLDERVANRIAEFVNALDNSTLMVINQDSPTRKPSSGLSSSPDLTITSSQLGLNASWKPKTTLNSDHPPIIVRIDGRFSEPQSGPSCYTNFRKINF